MAGSGKKKSSPLMSAVKGAIVGGIAVAGAMTLADEKKRQQLKDAFTDAKDKLSGYAETVKDKVQDTGEQVADKAEDIKGALHHAVEDFEDAV